MRPAPPGFTFHWTTLLCLPSKPYQDASKARPWGWCGRQRRAKQHSKSKVFFATRSLSVMSDSFLPRSHSSFQIKRKKPESPALIWVVLPTSLDCQAHSRSFWHTSYKCTLGLKNEMELGIFWSMLEWKYRKKHHILHETLMFCWTTLLNCKYNLREKRRKFQRTHWT